MSDGRKNEICEKLYATRRQLMSLLQSLETEQWGTAVFDEESSWSIADLLRHLVDAESGMTKLMENVRQGGEGVPADFDLKRWNERVVRKSREKSAVQLLEELETSRETLLAFIDSLEEGDWLKRGRHGSLRIMSIEEICHLIADHETTHFNDIRGALAG